MKKRKRQRNVKILTALLCMAVTAAMIISTVFKSVLDIGTDRQFVWNEEIVDLEKTTAAKRLHAPVKQNLVSVSGESLKKSGQAGFSIVQCDDGYMMYYPAGRAPGRSKICCAHSKNGIAWEKPGIGASASKFRGGYENSADVLFDEDSGVEGFFALRDTRQNIPASEKYKAVAIKSDGSVVSYVSPDGLDWKEKGSLGKNIKAGMSCSLFWNEKRQKYFCYFAQASKKSKIMLTTSKDFERWSAAMEISYPGRVNMLTANIFPYYRGNSMLIGLPLRGTEVEQKYMRANFGGRNTESNLLTDTIFISSRDGYKFSVTEEAWLTPGPQNGENWTFGDCLAGNGIIETPSIHSDKGQDRELSIYVSENGENLARYTLRMDGFVSYNAPYNTKKLVTKPLKFEGSRMTVNFSTSAGGYVYVRILNEKGKPFENITYTREDGREYNLPKYTSYKLAGDRTDREVAFNGDIRELAGKKVVLEFYMSDADIYSFKFDNEEYLDNSRWKPDEIEIREYGDFAYSREEVIDIGTDRYLFRDDYVIDPEKTDAVPVLHSPVRKGEIFKTDLPWEGDNCDFYVIVDDVDSRGQTYHRMYYLGWDSSDFTNIRVCYAYSYDGINYVKPTLGLHSYTDKNTGQVYDDTNIVLYTEEEIFDNFFVMKDTRPGVPEGERYKAICQGRYDQLGYPSYGLWAWVSPDGLHWTKTHRVLPQAEEWFGSFDSVNSLVWDDSSQQFFTYFRVREKQLVEGARWDDFRKIYGARGGEFEPFDTETLFELDYGENSPLFEMYTNNISKYYRASQIFIGFPTRFNRKSVWEKNYDYLSGTQKRLENYNSGQPTRALSFTDAMFMTSQDGYVWNRQNEAFITPDP